MNFFIRESVLLAAAARKYGDQRLVRLASLIAAPSQPAQKPVKLLGLGEGLDRQFANLTDEEVRPFRDTDKRLKKVHVGAEESKLPVRQKAYYCESPQDPNWFVSSTH